MRTLAKAKRERAELMKDIAKHERQKDRAHRRELEQQLREARAARKGQLTAARRRCIDARKGLRAKLKAQRERLLAELRAQAAAEMLAAREACDAGIAKAMELDTRAERARAILEEEKKYRAELRRLERHSRERSRELARPRTVAERRSESDDAVRVNLPPELLALWDRVKRSIRGDEYRSRTEAFLDYAAEHPGEVLESVEDRTDALVRELEERQARLAG